MTTSSPIGVRRRVPGILTLICTLALSLGALLSMPTAASANEVKVVTGITVENTSRDSQSTPYHVWDITKVKFTVDTTGSGAKAGDTFTIGLPDSMRTQITSFPMYANDGKTEVAKCTVPGGAGQTLTCTFTDYVNSHPDMKGGGWVRTQISKSEGVQNFTFKVPGNPIVVEIPGGMIKPGDLRGLPERAYKQGWVEGEVSPNLFYWRIWVNAGAYANSGQITVNDTFSDDHGGYKLSDESGRQPVLRVWKDSKKFESGADADETIKVGQSVGGGTFQFQPNEKGFAASWPRQDGYVYELGYYTVLKDPSQVKVGDAIQNHANVNGSDVKSDAAIATLGAGRLDGAGFGSISVTKAPLTGDAASQVDAAKEYTVKASYTVGGKEKSDTLSLKAGGPAKTIGSLPKGTKVTLSEIKPSDDGVTWGDPVFSSKDSNVKVADDGKSAVVTVGDRTLTSVVVTNKANRVATPPAQTTPPTPIAPPTTPGASVPPVPSTPSVTPSTPTATPSIPAATPSTPTATPSKPSLPDTGAAVLWLGVIGLLAVVVGGALMFLRKRDKG